MDESQPDLHSANLNFVEELYAAYLKDPGSVSSDWRVFFERQRNGGDEFARSPRVGPSFRPASIFNPPAGNGEVQRAPALRTPSPDFARPAGPAPVPSSEELPPIAHLQDRVDQLVRAYRVRGHMIASLDPLGLPRPHQPELDPEFYGLTDEHLDLKFSSRTIHGPDVMSLREILTRLRQTYCGNVGVQFMHIDDPELKHWIQQRIEDPSFKPKLTREEQLRILTRLTDAVMFEEFIQKKYIGSKSFSLEGGESLIPLLELAIEKSGEHKIDEIVLAMAHRGRLNVLVNIMGKSPRDIFLEFEDPDADTTRGSGDVKYHMGYSNDWITRAGRRVHLTLCFNPSHLEFVNPVAIGRVRAKQDRKGDKTRDRVMGLLIHGDAAFIGEGITQETLNLSELDGYTTGGTLHVILNNQIGFTTPPAQGRSCTYATDIAKMLQVPVFHVNGEDPESVAWVIRMAMDFRKTFRRDVVIDMYCYRKRGHNEGDEPSFTDPLLYKRIGERKSVREGYLDHLLKLGEVSRDEADDIGEARREHLEREFNYAREEKAIKLPETLSGHWRGYQGGPDSEVKKTETGLALEKLKPLLEAQTKLPDSFKPHSKIERFIEQRREMVAGERPLDWAAGEALAFASLLADGYPIRMTGQDCERGTFTQRHAVLHDVEDGHTYTPLSHLAEHLGGNQARFEIHNSPLSEAGVVGFEYGYSLDTPDGLVCWEAQFGDFSNAAQVIIDQFIVSAEDKWRRLSGLVMLLPHGFEGMGPEHSSARLERFLMLAAEDNIQVVYPTTPAQYFHVLRRQVVRPWRKPLVVMTPKGLLRHPRAVSPIEECCQGRFKRIIQDSLIDRHNGKVDRILFCTGKIYYELEKVREERERNDVAILRLEQLYPLQEETVREALAPYGDETPVIWVQEEPENMGAWRYLFSHFGSRLIGRFPFSGRYRKSSASPATGSGAAHKAEQVRLVEGAFGALE